MTDADWNPLTALRTAGFPVDDLTDEQRTVLAGLSAEEVALLLDIKRRLDLAAPDVEAHNVIAGAALF
jgi:hypothetical protein